ncbi:MAG TPA: DUF72 domain-containing protein [Bacteroidetes bacterium]|nr:DUF72 domain-containing protein [Bacteroidota bacterium]
MKFGKVEHPGALDLSLPADHVDTKGVLSAGGYFDKKPKVFIGCPRWAKADLKGFYPKGTKDELTYYSSQFNSIEMNAFYYRIFPTSTVDKWYERSAPNFTFFPKVPQLISQFRRLKNCENELNDYLVSISHFKEKLGTVFLQMNDNYGPSNFDDLAAFIEQWPTDLPLSVELRHSEWFNDLLVADKLYALLEENNVCQTITDTAGRRDIMHMRLTNNECFVRFTGANHPSDIDRLDEWFERLTEWKEQGVQQINFFIHQTIEKDLQMLSARLIEKINKDWGYDMHVPGSEQGSLF